MMKKNNIKITRKNQSEDELSTKEGQEDAILVTGGSGFIGRHLVKKLSKTNKTVVSMYHHRLPEPLPKVYPVCSDLGSVELLKAPLRGVDTVVYLAWENTFTGSEENIDIDLKSNRVPRNIQMLRNLLQAMEDAKTKRFIFMSANGANRYAQNSFLKEKYFAELVVLNSDIPEKIVLRPSVIYGDDNKYDRFIDSILNIMKFPGIYPVPKFNELIAPIHIDDIVSTIYELTKVEMVEPSTIIDIVGRDKYKVEELFKLVSDRFSKRAKLQIRGVIGEALLPIFEKNSRTAPNMPRLREILSLSNTLDINTQKDNPLKEAVPSNQHSFRRVMGG